MALAIMILWILMSLSILLAAIKDPKPFDFIEMSWLVLGMIFSPLAFAFSEVRQVIGILDEEGYL